MQGPGGGVVGQYKCINGCISDTTQYLCSQGARLWPGAVVPYQFADTIDYNEWQTMQYVFNNISSVTNIQFVPRYLR